MRWIEFFTNDQRRLGEEIALKQIKTEALTQTQLLSGLDLFSKQLLAKRLELLDNGTQAAGLHILNINLDNVSQSQQRPRQLINLDHIISGQHESQIMQLLTTRQNLRRRFDALKNFKSNQLLRQSLDQIAKQNIAVHIDEPAIGAKHIISR